jgi:hypothetical protein
MSRDLPRVSALLLLSSLLAAPALADDRHPSGKPGREPVRFALIGDVPYRDPDILKLDEVIREINAAQIDFTVHTGDIKSGSSSCADELLKARFDQLQQLKRPLVYTPGDNEWTDCHRPAAGGFEPLPRLAKVRALFFPKPSWTTGKQKAQVRSQSSDPAYAEYVENVLFERGDVVFATLHVVGSNNDLALWAGVGETAAAPRQDRIDEVARRTKAVLAWIDTAFDLAEQRGASGVFLAMQADPAIEAPKGDPLRNGFEEILAKISARTISFARPVLLGHGDSHLFRVDQLLTGPTLADGERRLEDFTRVENYGDTEVHWVEVQVDARTPEVFRVLPHIVAQNRFAR